MTANVGRADRLFRFVLGLILVASPLMNMPQIWSNEWAAYASMAVGAVLALTSMIRFCPLYRIVGISTCKL